MRDVTKRLLLSQMKPSESRRILDAGCGVGGNMRDLAEFGLVCGLDYSPFALNYARCDHAGRLVRANVEALPYADNSFDLVTSFDVLSANSVTYDDRVFREFCRVTRPGGYVLIRTAGMKSMAGAHDLHIKHERRYSDAEFRALLTQAGLKPLHVSYANSLLLPLIFPLRKFQRLRMKHVDTHPSSDISSLPEPLNNLLLNVLRVEARWIASRHRFPAGVSIYGLALKP
jgi:ubiquinone/menaquinone biosynthesis C-methylase UbiE